MRLTSALLTLLPALSVALEPFSTTYLAGAAVTAIGGYFFYQYDKCEKSECCQNPWVYEYPNLGFNELYGQPLVEKIVQNVIMQRHAYSRPLLLSFHGPVGIGKTFLSTLLAERLFKKGKESEYVHFFTVGYHFPNPAKSDLYYEMLKMKITHSLLLCSKSVFIFDEFEKMPPQLTEAVASFMEPRAVIDGIRTGEAIFILLSNTGSKAIVKKTYELYQDGLERKDFKLSDFEDDLKLAVYNEPGAYKDSVLIKKELVDAYVPFLPLEKEHVRNCISSEYRRFYSREPSEDTIQKILKGIKFTPDLGDLFAETGCKKVMALVARNLD